MKLDWYAKFVLTVIALCLIALTFQRGGFETTLRAQSSFNCSGEAKANAWGGVKESIGGYAIEFRCR